MFEWGGRERDRRYWPTAQPCVTISMIRGDAR
jgi:hypothetical protein